MTDAAPRPVVDPIDPIDAADALGLDAWRTLPAAQQPNRPDPAALREAPLTLTAMSASVVASEVDLLRERQAPVARGAAFLLPGGDCAEADQ